MRREQCRAWPGAVNFIERLRFWTVTVGKRKRNLVEVGGGVQPFKGIELCISWLPQAASLSFNYYIKNTFVHIVFCTTYDTCQGSLISQ